MPIGRIAITASIIALLLVAAVPVDAAPSLQTGTRSNYNLSASISFVQSCETLGTATPSIIVCPMMASFPMSTNAAGTVGWTVTDLTSTIAHLNVSRDLTISNGDSTRPVIRNVGSFNESVNLATRLVSLFPNIMPEMDQLLQMTQATTGASIAGVNLTASLPSFESVMPQRQFHTMWWVNGPLKLNQTIPVLALPTNVTGTSNVNLGGSLGSREAWTLTFNLTRSMFDPLISTSSTIPISDNLQVRFVFNYDKTSDLLLSATADIHTGFQDEIAVPSSTCIPTSSMACPNNSSPTMIMGSFGLNIQASLKLSTTTVDLSTRMTQTPPPQDNGGGTQSNSGSGDGNGSGSSTGSNGAGSTNSNDNGATGSTGQPSGNSNRPSYGASSLPWWIYAVLGILAVGLISSAVWVTRRRSKNRTNDASIQTAK